MEIKLYEDKYRDDMIFMVLQAKDALGRIPRLNEDLLDIKTRSVVRRNSGMSHIHSIRNTVVSNMSPGI